MGLGKDGCDYSSCWADAEVEITLDDGEIYLVCKDHVAPMILSVATTDNPVHELAELERVEAPEGFTAYRRV